MEGRSKESKLHVLCTKMLISNLFDDPFSAVDAHTGSHVFKVIYFCILMLLY